MSEIAAEPDRSEVAHENGLKVVWALAWPVVTLNILQTANSLLDVGFVGHLDTKSLTAYSAATPVTFLLFTFAMTFPTGTTAVVSRAFGAEQVEEFRMAAKQGLTIGLLLGVVIALAAINLSWVLPSLLIPKGSEAAGPHFLTYFAIFAAALPAMFLIQTLAAALRGIGDTRSPMVISGIQIMLHMLLNFILIFPPRQLAGGITFPGFNMGLAGAATALAVSAWLSAIGYLLYSDRTPLTAAWKLVAPTWQWFVRIMRISVPAVAMGVMRVFSFMVFQIILTKSEYGAIGVPAMRPTFSVESIMFMPAFGLSAAAAALVGQSLGMKRPDRAERLGWTASHLGAAITLALVIPVFVAAPYITPLLVADKPEIAAESARFLRYLCVTEVGFAYAMVTLGAMQGAGDTVRPFWITAFSLWGIRVPLTWILVHSSTMLFGFLPVPGLGWGLVGAWFAMSSTQLLQGVLCVLAFKQGKWKFKEV